MPENERSPPPSGSPWRGPYRGAGGFRPGGGFRLEHVREPERPGQLGDPFARHDDRFAVQGELLAGDLVVHAERHPRIMFDVPDLLGCARRADADLGAIPQVPDRRRVRTLIRTSVREAGGSEVDSRADEFFAVFAQARPAVDAALGIQRSLGERAWPRRAAVRVRIGIHTGRSKLTETGYVGIAVHTAARVCSAGHGGQILLTSAACDGLELADGVGIHGLGRHALPGLTEPEALFQVQASDLRATFPRPRRSAPTVRVSD